MQIEVGSILQGKITGIAPFGAFVELEGGKTGLVHISEISSEYVEDINKHVAPGQEVRVKVISIDPNEKISLSIKKAIDLEAHRDEAGKKKNKQPRRNDSPAGLGRKAPEVFEFAHKKEDLSFEDKLLKFKQDSDEKIRDLKKNTDNKRSGGYKRAY